MMAVTEQFEYVMRAFMEKTFGPRELEILDIVLEKWRAKHHLERTDPDVSIAAAVMLNLFREGKQTVPELEAALSSHKALADLIS
jgi:hypothetical protein